MFFFLQILNQYQDKSTLKLKTMVCFQQRGEIPLVGNVIEKAIDLFWPESEDVYDIWQLIVGEAGSNGKQWHCTRPYCVMWQIHVPSGYLT